MKFCVQKKLLWKLKIMLEQWEALIPSTFVSIELHSRTVGLLQELLIFLRHR